MRVVLVSQRVDVLADRGERRDALDQRLPDWLASHGLLPVPVPNRPERVNALWTQLKPCAVVLSGGNDLAEYGGDAPERDAVERALLARAMAERVPLFALCRGAQLLLDAFGNRLEQMAGHVGTRHRLVIDGRKVEVNSYHQWGCRSLIAPLEVLACSEDGVIEAFFHPQLPLLGVMWHPEREMPFAELDGLLLNRCLNKE
ncbi:MAG: gamma-glutamyl-gamma-aminobutyrate hydrolase family protein [Pseudomonas sp.]|uniref:gamma-glutamyl-gamma-aminobutyrate hydrolase family protein n=1 Tax=Pseudomonas sp. TaxID=306 RepID=UPI0027192341|nr:gamma-glutamyl-gamma-aminobutyrate hydrolase family protein [Pseudomonas sp.]MDO9619559.1 gamma-glutamyl-gamma-aminobutyrate hydrolase family protein [Pseudomonas sp.]MDP2446150.1 gamma-glutamyl-gamma-aminobutyrate hydrolase family protein [Pseudomonas sp.]MDZ4332787.1 gamma-glutamyl-gamma-aminobutyrate hydrolase family protein [Pseudomonas sp.]